jgi:hypothetical protein
MTAPRRVIDTSAWIEWLTGSPLGKKLSKEFPEKTLCIVPTRGCQLTQICQNLSTS